MLRNSPERSKPSDRISSNAYSSAFSDRDRITHLGYLDEASHNKGRFRSIALISLPSPVAARIEDDVAALLESSGVKEEFKWEKVRTAKYRLASLKLIDYMCGRAANGEIRVDALHWDTYDSRHRIARRDDNANLERMAYHLCYNVIERRWSNNSRWALYPDRGNSLEWPNLKKVLNSKIEHWKLQGLGFQIIPGSNSVSLIEPVISKKTPLGQIADLFAGISVFSRREFDKYRLWQERFYWPHHVAMKRVSHNSWPKLSNSERERATVLTHLLEVGHNAELGITISASKGLSTRKPTSPLNFWPYTPRHELDKAPVRNKGSEAA